MDTTKEPQAPRAESTHPKLKSEKILLLLAVAVVVIVAYFLYRTISAAGSTSLSLSPTSDQYHVGETITVTVNQSSSAKINAVQGDLSYNTHQLKYLNSTCMPPFTLPLPMPPSSGVAHLACAIPNRSITGKQAVGTISFKVLPSADSTTLSIASSSKIITADTTKNIWHGHSTGASYHILP